MPLSRDDVHGTMTITIIATGDVGTGKGLVLNEFAKQLTDLGFYVTLKNTDAYMISAILAKD